jgi:hypothetical protein
MESQASPKEEMGEIQLDEFPADAKSEETPF